VVFTSVRPGGVDDGYGRTAEAMLARAREQPGFLGVETARGADGVGITVSYWTSLEAIDRWRRDPVHMAAKARAAEWYADHRLRICRVEANGADGP
jgi:heme-degrading monooxygenase HmoA